MSHAADARHASPDEPRSRRPGRRAVLLVLLVAVIAALAWTAWLAFTTQRDLRDAEQAVDRLQTAVENGDDAGRDAAVADLRTAADGAHDSTDGLWWGAVTKVPFVGDDAAGVAALSESLAILGDDVVDPLLTTADSLDTLVSGGQVDVAAVEGLQQPVDRAGRALSQAVAAVDDEDSSGYVSALRGRFDEYVDRVEGLRSAMDSAGTAVEVLPTMLGRDGPRDYLLIFENNAEIRGTGGLPGSWAIVHAEQGRLEMRQQGAASDFPRYDPPIGDITDDERSVFGAEMGSYFQDPNFTPDFPRAAQVFDAFWAEKYPARKLDGVLAVDVVGLSYLIEGIGPVTVGDLTLTADNVVTELLSNVYTDPDPEAQDAVFRDAAKSIFTATTSNLTSPVDFVEGLGQAAREGRFLVAPFDETEAQTLAGTRVTGALPGDEGATPGVDIALNDATASKMSYYLRYRADVVADSCDGGVQQLTTTVRLNQTITSDDAAALPPYVTGGGLTGVPVGQQIVRMHVFAPAGGTIGEISIDGKRVGKGQEGVINGRPAVAVSVVLDSPDDVVVTVSMESGPGQDARGRLGITPGIVASETPGSFASAC